MLNRTLVTRWRKLKLQSFEDPPNLHTAPANLIRINGLSKSLRHGARGGIYWLLYSLVTEPKQRTQTQNLIT